MQTLPGATRRWAIRLSILLVFLILIVAGVWMFREWSIRLPTYRACERRVGRLERRMREAPKRSAMEGGGGTRWEAAPLGVETLHAQVEYARYRLAQLENSSKNNSASTRALPSDSPSPAPRKTWLSFWTSSKKAKLLKYQKFQMVLGGIERDYRQLQRGRDPYRNRKGTLLRAYFSDIDDTLQPFSLSIPRNYTGRDPFPLIVYLHAHGGFHPFQGHPTPKVADAIVLSPHGRGSNDYMFIGEQDVLHAIAATKRLYNIDDDRVYLMGQSMGGTGCWQVAAHHPETFAAIAPTCGNTDHTVWERKWGWGKVPISTSIYGDRGKAPDTAMLPLRRQVAKALDPITYAANLKNVPVFCAHGALDEVVPVEHSRNMVRRLREVGCQVKYEEFPDVGHGDFPPELFEDQIRWLLQHRRSSNPLPEPITVADVLPWQKGRMLALTGPIEEAFLSRFLIVYGTSSASQVENLVARREAESFVREWKRRYVHRCRMKTDKEVTDTDCTESNLILYGGPQHNSVTKQFESALPVHLHGDRISLGHNSFTGDNLGIKFCFPNPRNPRRYVVVLAGTTWKGLFQINQRFGNWFDWGVYDNRNWYDYAVFDNHSIDPEGFLVVGFFDKDWRFNNETQWQGDPGVRARVVPRQTPIFFEPPIDLRSFALSDLMPIEIDQQKGAVELNRSFRANPLRVCNRKFSKGLGVRAPSRVVYDLKGGWKRLRATVGLDPEGEPVSEARREVERVQFKIIGDGRLLGESPEIDWNAQPYVLNISVAGIRRLELVTEPKDWRQWLFGSAAWGEVEVSR